MTASRIAILGWGNPSRGDDALGPALIERLEEERGRQPDWPAIDLITDFQLQIEHAADLVGRDLVLFIDAGAACPAPFRFTSLHPARDIGYTTHAMSPQSVLRVFEQVYQRPAPPAFLLMVRGARFELGEPLSAEAAGNLGAAFGFLRRLCANPTPEAWGACAEQGAAASSPADASRKSSQGNL